MLKTLAGTAVAIVALMGLAGAAHAEESGSMRIEHVVKATKAELLDMTRKERRVIVPQVARWMKPCKFEDSRWCVWHADVMGNDRGDSFIDKGGVAFYFNGKVKR